MLPQESAALDVTGQASKKQAMAFVAASQSSSRPDVRSPQALVMSETAMLGMFSISETMAPVSMSLKRLAASVTAASAAPTSWLGRVMKMPTTSEKAEMTSLGRSWMMVGTWPSSICSTNCCAWPASVSRVWIMLQGMSLAYLTILSERRRPLMMILLRILVCVVG